MENEMIQRSVPNEPLEGMPEEYEDPELLEEEVGESEFKNQLNVHPRGDNEIEIGRASCRARV